MARMALPKRRSRLALRIYLFGLIQFVVVAMAMDLDHRLRGPPPPHPSMSAEGPRPRPHRSHGPPWLGWPIAVVLAVVGVTSWLTARSIARPLAQLTDATRSFGEGRLDARAKLERSDEIGDVAEAFDDMADRITTLLLAERELLANVSHELRTPLARIRVALDLANEGDARMAMESLGEIAQDLAELERVVDDVLASARLALETSGPSSQPALPMRAEHVESRALLEKSAAKFRTAHPNRPLRVELAGDLPAINADLVLIRRVFDNLLDNAHKYTEAPDSPIVLEARADGEDLLVEVTDQGVGIAKEDLARLFEPFFRADRSRTRATGGLGLGLALARRVVIAHKGTITFESEPGRGTVARVRIPCI
jgi:two-component system OmpR family sensor kinase